MIPLCEPNLTGKEKEYVTDAISSGWVSGGGEYVERFEDMVAKACGRKWCVATITGTAALHVALQVVGGSHRLVGPEDRPGILPGDIVSVRSLTFVAGANVVRYMGATPHFKDVYLRGEEDGWDNTFDCSLVGAVFDTAGAIGRKDFYGTCCLSFNGNKTITTGQGGAVVGDDTETERKIRHLVNVAKGRRLTRTGPRIYEHDAVGFNYRMANLNAAMGCAQMERLDEFLEAKARVMRRYGGLNMAPSSWMAIAKVNARETVIGKLREDGIDARQFWKPLHLLEPYKNCPRASLPNTEAIADKLVCLPCSTHLTEEQQDHVIKCVSSL